MRWWWAAILLISFPQDSPDWTKLRSKLEPLSSDFADEREAAREAVKFLDRATLVKGLKVKETRDVAALALGIQGDIAAKDALVELTKSKDAAVRARAFEAMGGLKLQETVFTKAMLDEPRVALAAARALAKSVSVARLQALYTASWSEVAGGKPETTVRMIALGSVAYPESVPSLMSGYLVAKDAAPANTAVLALAQVESADALKTPGTSILDRLRAFRARKDAGEAEVSLAGLIMLRLGALNGDDLASLLTDRSSRVRAKAIEFAAPKDLAKKDVGRWLEWLENEAITKEHGKVIEGWLAKVTGIPDDGERADRLKAWNDWWKKQRDAIFYESVSKAIDAGVTWLKSKANKGRWNDSFGETGLTALCTYTLLKSGVSVTDETVAAALAFLVKQPFNGPGLEGGTYRTALLAMCLTEAATLYRKPADAKEDLGAKYRKRANEAAAWLVQVQRGSGGWNYGTEGNEDNSNVQFAILGLRAAMNGGAKIGQATWTKADRYLAKLQHADGGWGYSSEAPYGSMTAAGLCGLLIARSSDKEKLPSDLLKDKEIARALAWLDENWTMEGHLYKNGGVGSGIGSAYYWLWSLERCCLVAGLEKIGKHDWYREGAEYIVGRQTKDGQWEGQEGTADHCFALLFLKRAYVPVATPGSADKK